MRKSFSLAQVLGSAAARTGGDYLLRMQKSDGGFNYSYELATDEFDQIKYNISQHFAGDKKFKLPNPQRPAGGFRESLDVMRIRIDFVQHNISSRLGIAELLY
jgi:hypothetical protein